MTAAADFIDLLRGTYLHPLANAMDLDTLGHAMTVWAVFTDKGWATLPLKSITKKKRAPVDRLCRY
jgi:hypothetical protein